MADSDDSPDGASMHRTPAPTAEDDDPTDETQDFRFLSALSTTPSPAQSTLPRRGAKDFEPHGTAAQAAQLQASRAAMHRALAPPRLHPARTHVVATHDAGTATTLVRRSRGSAFRTIGTPAAGGGCWLKAEEALYLVERGGLDVRLTVGGAGSGERGREHDGAVEGSDGVPLSLQGAYALFVGVQGLTLERFAVYAGLRRSGYVVERAPGWDGGGEEEGRAENEAERAGRRDGLWDMGWGWLYERLFRPSVPPLGPLAGPGLYRSYSAQEIAFRSNKHVG
jgi:tRNA-splicing endonuclease subunit Sen54